MRSRTLLDVTLAQGSGHYTAFVEVDNARGTLLPYMSADVRIITGERKRVLLVPSAALRWRPQREQVAADARAAFDAWRQQGKRAEPVVWVEEKGFVRPIKVKTGLSDGTVTEVTAGELEEGTEVVVGVK